CSSRGRRRSTRRPPRASPKSCLADRHGVRAVRRRTARTSPLALANALTPWATFLRAGPGPDPVRPQVGDAESLPDHFPERWGVPLRRVLRGLDAEPAHAGGMRVRDPARDESALG